MLQPLHPYGAVLNLDVIDFRNMEKLIDEWVAAIKITATTLELDKENFIKLVELSLEGFVKIGWDNTPADTKASILARDSKSAIADRLGRLIKIHFIGDGYFEGSRTEKAREYAQALFSLELRSICAVDEYIYWFRKYFFQSGVAVDVAAPMFFAKICSPWREMLIQSYKENQVSQEKGRNTGVIYTPGISEELLSGEDHGGPKPKPEHTNLGNGVDQQGFHPKDLDEQTQDPPDEPLRRELSNEPIPGRMKVSKIATAGHVQQEDISLQIARRNVNDGVKQNHGRIMRQDSNLSPYDGFRIGGIGRVLNQIGLNQRKHHIIYKVSSGEFAIPMEFTGNVMEMQLILKEEILEELSRLKEEIAVTMKWIHIGTIEVQPVVGRYEGMLEIADHEFLVAGVAGRENGCMTLGLSFLEDHKPWGRKAYIDSGSGICTAKPGVFPKEARETLPVISGRDFSQKILILNTGIREAKIMIGGAFGMPWFRDNQRNLLIFTTNCGNEIQDKRKFGKVLLSFRQQGLIDSDSFYKESEEEIENLNQALVELKTMDISEESKLSLENVKRLIQRNFSENPPAWWDRNKIEATLKSKKNANMSLVLSEKKATIAVNKIEFLGILIDEAGIELQEHIVEKIRNFPDILKDKKQLRSFLGVVNFAGIFIKDLAKYRKDFRPLLKETESAKWKWEEIHTQRVRELKQVCNNLPKLAIPQDEDELIVYTDTNDYRWAAVLMKKTTTGEEPCRYTGGVVHGTTSPSVAHQRERILCGLEGF
ncbi:Enzymatic polyprotein [Sesamum angolense]|uniref:Enzymatic polyprotein n=1 Tax=Sesamum angolense TaxID=2727404 RepID=A0AAE1WPZ2_9LAMI|nr:Enzymatic polyprotein [Sesamum angolense]